MRVIPAIDVRDGACVQLVGGDYDAERVRIADPLAVLERWADAGFARVHIVDLDAATGRGANAALVSALIAAAARRRVRCQVGGGLRDADAVDRVLALGADRVVVGTRGIEDPDWLRMLAAKRPGRVVLAVDVRAGRVTTHGWRRGDGPDPAVLRAGLAALPLAGMLVTAVDVEGTCAGPDLALIESLVRIPGPPVIASGGIASRADLDALAAAGVAEAVAGMALYTGELTPEDCSGGIPT